MNDWYEVKKIHDQLYMISENKHWEQTHMYYFLGKKRNLLIDTGTGLFPVREVVEKIDYKPIDVLITHAHWDHIGNINEFDNVYIHEADGDWLVKGIPLDQERIVEMITRDVEKKYLDNVDMDSLGVPRIEKYKIVKENTLQELGYPLKVIHVPGHSPGHVAIYEVEKQLLIAGDIVYTGTIYCHFESTDPEDLLASYENLLELEIEDIYTGHYEVPLKSDLLEDLRKILLDFKLEDKLNHGSGLKTYNNVSVLL